MKLRGGSISWSGSGPVSDFAGVSASGEGRTLFARWSKLHLGPQNLAPS